MKQIEKMKEFMEGYFKSPWYNNDNVSVTDIWNILQAGIVEPEEKKCNHILDHEKCFSSLPPKYKCIKCGEYFEWECKPAKDTIPISREIAENWLVRYNDLGGNKTHENLKREIKQALKAGE